ncbi:MAG: glycoside hydrolase family 25 protein, partial [Angelakisella sp.]
RSEPLPITQLFGLSTGPVLLDTNELPALNQEFGIIPPKPQPKPQPKPEPEPVPTGPLNSFQQNGMLAVSDLERLANLYIKNGVKIPGDFLAAISGAGQISVSRFEALCKQYGVSQLYMQRFIDDNFVYKMGNTYHYVPIQESLKMHRYNWDNLTGVFTDEMDYVVKGKSRAVKGIDISAYQGDIDWPRVKADGVEYAFIRLGNRGYSKGAIVMDEKYHQNMQGAQSVGIKVGVYFYSQAVNNAEAIEEANYVLQNIQGYTLELPVVFDIEGGQNSSYRTYSLSVQTATNLTKAFCKTIKNAGHEVLIYTYAKYFSEHLDIGQLQGYDFWLAQYYPIPFFPYNFQYWQYSCEGKVDGIKGNVDMNLLFLDYKR